MAKSKSMPDVFKLSSGLRCKPGDLAIIVSSEFPENIGAIIEIEKSADAWGKSHGYDWEAKSVGRKIKGRDLKSNVECSFTEIYCVDYRLVPVTGLPLDETTEVEDGVLA
jgi:hypothetical protein